jgi:hypothetical protein
VAGARPRVLLATAAGEERERASSLRLLTALRRCGSQARLLDNVPRQTGANGARRHELALVSGYLTEQLTGPQGSGAPAPAKRRTTKGPLRRHGAPRKAKPQQALPRKAPRIVRGTAKHPAAARPRGPAAPLHGRPAPPSPPPPPKPPRPAGAARPPETPAAPETSTGPEVRRRAPEQKARRP